MQKIILAGIIILAIFLRFYHINENLVFHGELGDNYLVVKNTLGKGIIPLLGPPTSHPWLSFGPLFYYVFGPFLILNKWNPDTGAYFFGVISIFGIIGNYFLVKKYFDTKTALISSYLIAVSTVWIDLARQARFFSMVAYLFYPFLLMTTKTLERQSRKNFFLLGLVFGIMVNFHLAPVFLLPAIFLLVFSNRKNVEIKQIMIGVIGFLIPNIPFLIYNLKTGFGMIAKFAVWIPYRSAIYHNFNLGFTFNMIYQFFGGILVIPVLAALYIERKNKVVQILALFLFFGILALILHKDPPAHYFYVLYPIPVILLSILISKLKSFLIAAVIFLLTVVNFTSKPVLNNNVPYKLQVEAAHEIIKEANGRPFNLHRSGYSDQFDGEYAQNYRYLLWYFGNEPKDYSTGLSYKIIEYIK